MGDASPVWIQDIRALLFDFDGVLMKSIEDHHRSWNRAFQPHGVEVGWEEFATLEGQSLYTIAEQLAARHGLSRESGRDIAQSKNEYYLATATFMLYDDALNVLDFFGQRGYELALVTGAHRDRLGRSIDSAFRSRFAAIVTADDVRETKPNPEPFLCAASRLARTSGECMVIENAPLGVEAAKRAGMKCVALTTTLSKSYLADADIIANSLVDVMNLFKTHGTPP